MKKQLEEERKEQKLFLETLTCVVRGETPRVALGRVENNTVDEKRYTLIFKLLQTCFRRSSF